MRKQRNLRVVADYHNTISELPDFFLQYCGELIIVSGVAQSRRPILESLLKIDRIDYKTLYTYPGEWTDNEGKLRSKIWKIEKIISLKPDVFIDDDLTTVLAIKKALPKARTLLFVSDDYSFIDDREKYAKASKGKRKDRALQML